MATEFDIPTPPSEDMIPDIVEPSADVLGDFDIGAYDNIPEIDDMEGYHKFLEEYIPDSGSNGLRPVEDDLIEKEYNKKIVEDIIKALKEQKGGERMATVLIANKVYGISQVELAKRFNLSSQRINAIVQKALRLSPRLAIQLGYSAGELLKI
jgi:hypothetical protein